MHYLIEFWFELSRESHRPAKWVASKILASVKGCENVLRWGGGGAPPWGVGGCRSCWWWLNWFGKRGGEEEPGEEHGPTFGISNHIFFFYLTV